MINGDLVFTQIGSPTNAISAVTEGYKGARVDHVGILMETPLGLFVLEAFPPEVRLTNFQVFIKRSSINNPEEVPRYLIARLKDEHQNLLAKALLYGLAQRDIPYDRRYLTDEQALYCSELVVDMFKFASDGIPFFPEAPMSFRDKATGELHPYWIEHYSYFGIEVPEGQPGSNPGELSKDEKLEIISIRGNISGYSHQNKP